VSAARFLRATRFLGSQMQLNPALRPHEAAEAVEADGKRPMARSMNATTYIIPLRCTMRADEDIWAILILMMAGKSVKPI
jgi:hypothetical protein